MKNRCYQKFAAVLILLFSFSAFSSAETTGPGEVVRNAVEEILVILRTEGLDQAARQARIEKIVDEQFDFRTMSQSVLATHWQKASKEERERFAEFFSQYLENTYMTAIDSAYTDQYVEYGEVKMKGDRAIVKTDIVSESKKIPVDYKMKLNGDKWFAYDVVIEGVSLVNNYRNTFASIIKTDGMQGLLDSLETKIKRYKETQASETN